MHIIKILGKYVENQNEPISWSLEKVYSEV